MGRQPSRWPVVELPVDGRGSGRLTGTLVGVRAVGWQTGRWPVVEFPVDGRGSGRLTGTLVGVRAVGWQTGRWPVVEFPVDGRDWGRWLGRGSAAEPMAGGRVSGRRPGLGAVDRDVGWCAGRGLADGPLAGGRADGRRPKLGSVGSVAGRQASCLPSAVSRQPTGEPPAAGRVSGRRPGPSAGQVRRPVHTPVSGRAGAVHHVPAPRTARSTGARSLWHGSDRSGTRPGIPVHPCDDSSARSRRGCPPRGDVAADTSTRGRRDGRT